MSIPTLLDTTHANVCTGRKPAAIDPVFLQFRNRVVYSILRAGYTRRWVAAELGVSPRTIHNWIHQALTDSSPAGLEFRRQYLAHPPTPRRNSPLSLVKAAAGRNRAGKPMRSQPLRNQTVPAATPTAVAIQGSQPAPDTPQGRSPAPHASP